MMKVIWIASVMLLVGLSHQQSPNPDCNLEREQGPCRARFRRYFYDPGTEMCKKFNYGGCRGNANNFKTKAQCEAKCVPVCKLKPEVGRCRARKRRFFYDLDTKRCKTFYYGGCGGNANNFKTKAECEKKCAPVCELKPEVGRCRARKRRFFYNSDFHECEEFFYGGCGGNANNFKTIAECEKKCVPVCSLEPEVGRCRAAIPRFHYDPYSETCEEFTYGGCGGNANNFKTIAECQKKCVPVCNLEPEVGRCKAAIPRFHYNPYSETCEEFTYGGCGGNANNFKTIAECQKKCVPVCSLEPEVGRCRAAIPRFYYDPYSETCEEFTYGGCGGNANNFETIAECEDKCAWSFR